jgi:hypothetical protein
MPQIQRPRAVLAKQSARSKTRNPSKPGASANNKRTVISSSGAGGNENPVELNVAERRGAS